MKLGHQVITSILADDLCSEGIKGQKGLYTSERNNAIACRFFFHFNIKGLRYERAVLELNKEFFLSEIRLAQIVMERRDYLKQLKTDKADRKALQKMFPHYNWY